MTLELFGNGSAFAHTGPDAEVMVRPQGGSQAEELARLKCKKQKAPDATPVGGGHHRRQEGC